MRYIPEKEKDVIEKAIYLPMLLTVLDKDLKVFNKSDVKLKAPYIAWIEETMIAIQKELSVIKRYMKQHQIKVEKIKTEETFTQYLFIYKGYEESHRYFNPRLRNRTEELMRYYLYERFQDSKE
ncbi:hypothetical protein J6TS2_11900 [Heyndrickxia sporothermodurans]|nr:hypothetical protein J6TS2_11900 [Heyndrickxia sporothermodurans]